jgi:hypothetical protein
VRAAGSRRLAEGETERGHGADTYFWGFQAAPEEKVKQPFAEKLNPYVETSKDLFLCKPCHLGNNAFSYLIHKQVFCSCALAS